VLIGLTSIGLSGLGIPYVLAIGMWALAAGTAVTLCQRMHAVYQDARSKAAPSPAAQAPVAERAPQPAERATQSEEA
jgi:CDP-diacylglycerol---glycerol-3-phosphate 3-phosphatidyltransferase